MNNRDFKGIWIPKELWLNNELTLIEKIILVEIDSLDNENHCTAGNEYLAEFCNCSESKVSKAIKKLIERNYIQQVSFDGRQRVLKSNELLKNTKQSSKIYESESQNLLYNNISNTKDNYTNTKVLDNYSNINNTKVLLENSENPFLKTQSKEVKQNMYSKCIHIIDGFTDDLELRNLLVDYFNLLLDIFRNENKTMYVNIWKSKLNILKDLCLDNEEFNIARALLIVRQSIDKGWKSFYPFSSNSYKSNQYKDNMQHFERDTNYDLANEEF